MAQRQCVHDGHVFLKIVKFLPVYFLKFEKELYEASQFALNVAASKLTAFREWDN